MADTWVVDLVEPTAATWDHWLVAPKACRKADCLASWQAEARAVTKAFSQVVEWVDCLAVLTAARWGERLAAVMVASTAGCWAEN